MVNVPPTANAKPPTTMEIPGSVHHILQGKPAHVWTITSDVLVIDAIRLMGEKDIGALVVTDGPAVLGMISERDYSRKVALQGRTSRDTRVADVISTPAVTVTQATSIPECMRLMTQLRIRHLPVVDDHGLLAGIVSMGDLVNWTIRVQSEAIHHLEGYITGQYPA